MEKVRKNSCPGCGAPLPPANGDGAVTCVYCGQHLAVKAIPGKKKAIPETEVRIIRPKRNALDYILITLGIVWCVVMAAFVIDRQYWRKASDIIAALFLTTPGILLLMIGFRRKKVKIVRGERSGAEK